MSHASASRASAAILLFLVLLGSTTAAQAQSATTLDGLIRLISAEQDRVAPLPDGPSRMVTVFTLAWNDPAEIRCRVAPAVRRRGEAVLEESLSSTFDRAAFESAVRDALEVTSSENVAGGWIVAVRVVRPDALFWNMGLTRIGRIVRCERTTVVEGTDGIGGLEISDACELSYTFRRSDGEAFSGAENRLDSTLEPSDTTVSIIHESDGSVGVFADGNTAYVVRVRRPASEARHVVLRLTALHDGIPVLDGTVVVGLCGADEPDPPVATPVAPCPEVVACPEATPCPECICGGFADESCPPVVPPCPEVEEPPPSLAARTNRVFFDIGGAPAYSWLFSRTSVGGFRAEVVQSVGEFAIVHMSGGGTWHVGGDAYFGVRGGLEFGYGHLWGIREDIGVSLAESVFVGRAELGLALEFAKADYRGSWRVAMLSPVFVANLVAGPTYANVNLGAGGRIMFGFGPDSPVLLGFQAFWLGAAYGGGSLGILFGATLD